MRNAEEGGWRGFFVHLAQGRADIRAFSFIWHAASQRRGFTPLPPRRPVGHHLFWLDVVWWLRPQAPRPIRRRAHPSGRGLVLVLGGRRLEGPGDVGRAKPQRRCGGDGVPSAMCTATTVCAGPPAG